MQSFFYNTQEETPAKGLGKSPKKPALSSVRLRAFMQSSHGMGSIPAQESAHACISGCGPRAADRRCSEQGHSAHGEEGTPLAGSVGRKHSLKNRLLSL